MTPIDDHDYLARRVEQARNAAAAAATPAIRRIHLHLAAHYADRLAASERDQTRIGIST